MGNIHFDTSDVISIFALTISILFGIGNFIYTRRMFLVSTNPSIHVDLSFYHPDPLRDIRPNNRRGHRLYVRINNLSDKITIANITASIAVKDPHRRWKFYKPKWLLLVSGTVDLMSPGSEVIITMANTLETLLIHKVPGMIKEIVVPNYYDEDDIRHQRSLVYYTPLDLRPLELRISTSFRPGLSGVKLCRERSYFQLIPDTLTKGAGLPSPECDWQIESKNKNI